MKQIFNLVATAVVMFYGCTGGKKVTAGKGVVIVQNDSAKSFDVVVNGQPFTSYTWPDSVFKPVLYPIINASGTEITRGYPLKPRPGERVDHPHHVGLWLNYGNVNGIDFWGNSYDIPADTRGKTGGIIKFLRAENIKNGDSTATLTVYNSWQDPAGNELLYEKTVFDFITRGNIRIIDRNTTLTATSGAVNFPDTKEGMFAVRVARQLELPSKESVTLTDAQNRPTNVPQMTNEGVTGNYRSSEGVTGDSVWSTRAKWMTLFGIINNDSVSVAICDHPKNPGYPTHWHARGYGLFSANPLGVKDFTGGRQTMNFNIAANQSESFRYRVIITANTHLSDRDINILANEFATKY